MLLNCGNDVTQQRVAGAVTVSVVDLLEPIDVDVDEDQVPVSASRAVDLTFQQQQPDPTTERAGELIKLRLAQVVSAQGVIAVGVGAVFNRGFAIGGGVRSVSSVLGAVHGPPVGCRLFDPVVRPGLISVSDGRLATIRVSTTQLRALVGRRLGAVTLSRSRLSQHSRALATRRRMAPVPPALVEL